MQTLRLVLGGGISFLGYITIILAVILTVITYDQFSSVQKRVVSLAELQRSAQSEALLIQAITAYRIRIRSLYRDRNVSTQELTMTLRCSIQRVNGGPWSCPDRHIFDPTGTEPDWAQWLAGQQLIDLGNGAEVRGQVTDVSRATDALQTLTLTLSTEGSVGPVKRTVQLRLGSLSVFRNAMTGNRLDAVMTNGRVFGDIAQYDAFNTLVPVSTTIYGNVYSAPPHALPEADLHREGWFWIREIPPGSPEYATRFPTSAYPRDDRDSYTDYMVGVAKRCKNSLPSWPAWLGGPIPNPCETYLSSDEPRDERDSLFMHDFVDQYDGPSIEWNFVRQEMILPKLDPRAIAELSSGQVTGRMIRVPKGSVYAGQAWQPRSIIKARGAGNYLIDGRTTPIEISGRVFIDGDLVILGRVSGRGSIAVSGSIFIPARLVYDNPPPHFDGSETSITKMAGVSQNASILAKEMTVDPSGRRYDQLSLLAAQNVIVGNPFDQLENHPDSDVSYINHDNLRRYTGFTSVHEDLPDSESNIVVDTRTGDLLDVKVMSGAVNRCVLKPWETPDRCIPVDHPDIAPHIKFLRLGSQYADRETMSDRALSSELIFASRGPAFRQIFEPNNWEAGRQTFWIGRADFFRLTQDTSAPEYQRAIQVDSIGRRGVSLAVELVPDQPFQLTSWFNPVETERLIETTLGSISQMNGASGRPVLQIHNAENVVPGSSPAQMQNPRLRPAVQHLRAAWQRCFEILGDDNTGLSTGWADIGAAWPGQSRDNLSSPSPKPYTLQEAFPPYTATDRIGQVSATSLPPYTSEPLFVGQYQCMAFLHLDQSFSMPGVGGAPRDYRGFLSLNTRVNAAILNPFFQMYIPPLAWSPDFGRTVCDQGWDYYGEEVFDSPYARKPCIDNPSIWSVADYAAGYAPRSFTKLPVWYGRLEGDAKFEHLAMLPWSILKIPSRTTYWDPAKVKIKPVVDRIDAFVFANHFFGQIYSSVADRQLRIHGGVVAKDFLGRTVNMLGRGRDYVEDRIRTDSADWQPGMGNMPSLWVVQDPRFQFREDIFDREFLAITRSR